MTNHESPSAIPGTNRPFLRRLPVHLRWLPVPLLLATILVLWIAGPRTPYESRTAMVLLNLFVTWLASFALSASPSLSSPGTGTTNQI